MTDPLRVFQRNAPNPNRKNHETDTTSGPAEGDTTPRCARGHGLIRMPGECKHCDRWAKEREEAHGVEA